MIIQLLLSIHYMLLKKEYHCIRILNRAENAVWPYYSFMRCKKVLLCDLRNAATTYRFAPTVLQDISPPQQVVGSRRQRSLARRYDSIYGHNYISWCRSSTVCLAAWQNNNVHVCYKMRLCGHCYSGLSYVHCYSGLSYITSICETDNLCNFYGCNLYWTIHTHHTTRTVRIVVTAGRVL